jgi:glycosyltransferase involved in cell wall biosynthesis
VAVIIPALNEEITISGVVKACLAALDPRRFTVAVWVVDDGSRDRTAELARQAGASVITHTANRGVGRAFQSGLAEALGSGAEIIVNIDADGQFNPADIAELIEPILKNRADMVTASRFKDSRLVPAMRWANLWGNRMMSRIISSIASHRFHDVSCGFRAYAREAALRLNLWGDFTYTQESLLDMHIKGMRIEEVPLRVRGQREHGQSRVASSLFRYGVRAATIILHTYRDFWPMHFFGWLSLVFFLPGMGLLSFLLVHRLRSGQFSPQIWAGFVGASLSALGILVLITGMLAEMLKRLRLNQEAVLYYAKKQDLSRPGRRGTTA